MKGHEPFGLQRQTPPGSFRAPCLPASRSADRRPHTGPLGAGPRQCRGQAASGVQAPSPRQSSGLGRLRPSQTPPSGFC